MNLRRSGASLGVAVGIATMGGSLAADAVLEASALSNLLSDGAGEVGVVTHGSGQQEGRTLRLRTNKTMDRRRLMNDPPKKDQTETFQDYRRGDASETFQDYRRGDASNTKNSAMKAALDAESNETEAERLERLRKSKSTETDSTEGESAEDRSLDKQDDSENSIDYTDKSETEVPEKEVCPNGSSGLTSLDFEDPTPAQANASEQGGSDDQCEQFINTGQHSDYRCICIYQCEQMNNTGQHEQ
eukprot:GHVQ01035838.1.p1 GENE.GHVQ01035838.1~~GHVQ01035838.1.p1  ORF type:complete len:244 (+),score=33.18 GHVQ01035838.1:152-883(+)